MELEGFRYGDPVDPPAGIATVGLPHRAVTALPNGSGLFIEFVEEAALPEFLARPIKGDARVLPVLTDARGTREVPRASAVERVREEVITGIPEPRTAAWCFRHLASEGRNFEVHSSTSGASATCS